MHMIRTRVITWVVSLQPWLQPGLQPNFVLTGGFSVSLCHMSQCLWNLKSKTTRNTLINKHLFSSQPPQHTFSLIHTNKCISETIFTEPKQKMEKRALLGVRTRRPIKRSKKKLLKKVADYLKSDSYMFAPLISPQPKIFHSSASSSNYRAFVFFFFFFSIKFLGLFYNIQCFCWWVFHNFP